ncbi:MAG: iron-sulfur cluster insertion protein ErpA [Chloroflexi bacterium]|nr:iron-sulfur cluster insertion protein ErpA [Chloroflexota bacterium]MCC6891317.1 iron-sulfur cluster insertion protein ErpA [Anaerolineae bacterium]
MSVIEQEILQTTIDITPVLSVTPSAVEVIRNLLQQRNIPNHSLRVFVSGGGCSGMQYGMAFEESPKEFDQVVAIDGVSLLIDSTSLMYLQGATIDYVDSLMGGGFRIENPNAVSSCGCGSSFRTGKDSEESSGSCSSCSH